MAGTFLEGTHAQIPTLVAQERQKGVSSCLHDTLIGIFRAPRSDQFVQVSIS